jgi:hypothetical protein
MRLACINRGPTTPFRNCYRFGASFSNVPRQHYFRRTGTDVDRLYHPSSGNVCVLALSKQDAAILVHGTADCDRWFGSSYLRERVQHIAIEYRGYRESNHPTSTGQRLEYWRVSIRAIAEAPLFGHGTGATKHYLTGKPKGRAGLGLIQSEIRTIKRCRLPAVGYFGLHHPLRDVVLPISCCFERRVSRGG